MTALLRYLARIGLCLVAMAGFAAAKENYRFPAVGQESAVLTIHASADISAIEPMIRDFQQAEPGITVDFTDYLTNELYDLLSAQCAGGEKMADIVISSSVDHIAKLANDGCAQAYDSPNTNRIPDWAKWRNEVFGFTFEPAVIVYNRNLVPAADIPRTHHDLAELLRAKSELYDGKIGTYDIERSGIGYLFAFFDTQQSNIFGRLLESFGRSRATLRCCTGELLSRIESGELLIGYNLIGSYAYGRYKAGAPIGIVMPRDYTLVLSRTAMIPAKAGRTDLGRKFLDYLLSSRGQSVAVEKSFFFSFDRPVPEGVDAVDPGAGSGVYRPIMIGPALLATLDQQNRQRFLAEWKASMERD
ncbi:ABC transporter substrate-binding protein [Nordella sp. HKS 07]|uniref:ABC transporter substrate-binding protein n=1 Tax=Nordella sp. HKS 07 TaxID=2712222 RepID=UPI0013E0F5D5|nr:ABC transporter substrate-binding protein [Nordella sp. HKS 07]QIG46422.1 ABC transporter substrate-binding protein [Nordella sp. HKS 07]